MIPLFAHEFSKEDAEYYNSWQPASGYRSGWRVVRSNFEKREDGFWYSGERGLIEFCGESGRLRLFKSYQSAKKIADKMNEEIK